MFDSSTVINEIEAYLLGFLYADGSVFGYSYGKYRVQSIKLAEKDRCFLEMIANIFSEMTGKEYSIKYASKTNSYGVTICSTWLIEKLIQQGISHNKTYENSSFVFDNVPDKLKPHFIRGYMDGDGSIGLYSNKARVSFVSLNRELLYAIQIFLINQDMHCSVYQDGKYWRLRFSGNPSCLQFLGWIYNNAWIYMERKYETYLKIPAPIYEKYNYHGIYFQQSKYVIYVGGDYVGVRKTVREAVDAYNEIAIKRGLTIQIYKGDDLVNEKYFFNRKMARQRKYII